MRLCMVSSARVLSETPGVICCCQVVGRSVVVLGVSISHCVFPVDNFRNAHLVPDGLVKQRGPSKLHHARTPIRVMVRNPLLGVLAFC